MKIYISDLRKAKMCARGSRAFFLTQGWDWRDLLKNGRDAQDFINTNDAMAMQVVEVANGRKQ
mgnify:CR=1 FL=1